MERKNILAYGEDFVTRKMVPWGGTQGKGKEVWREARQAEKIFWRRKKNAEGSPGRVRSDERKRSGQQRGPADGWKETFKGKTGKKGSRKFFGKGTCSGRRKPSQEKKRQGREKGGGGGIWLPGERLLSGNRESEKGGGGRGRKTTPERNSHQKGGPTHCKKRERREEKGSSKRAKKRKLIAMPARGKGFFSGKLRRKGNPLNEEKKGNNSQGKGKKFHGGGEREKGERPWIVEGGKKFSPEKKKKTHLNLQKKKIKKKKKGIGTHQEVDCHRQTWQNSGERKENWGGE